jgi:hypothetical protein
MVTLKDEQLAGLVQSVGFSSTRLHRGVREDVTAVAIILCESGGNPNAHNDNKSTGDDSYGLFQINMLGQMGKDRAALYGLRSYANLFEPKRNAEIAYDLFKRRGNTFGDWSCYNRGSYATHIPRASRAVQSPDMRLPTLEGFLEENVPGADALNQLGSLASFVTDKENWKRVGLFVGGGIAIIVGVMLWAKESPTVRQAAGTAVTVATRGKL